jgi:hypothetical protein
MIGKVDELQLKAMFETSAEVLGGLSKAFSDLRAQERKRLALGPFKRRVLVASISDDQRRPLDAASGLTSRH